MSPFDKLRVNRARVRREEEPLDLLPERQRLLLALPDFERERATYLEDIPIMAPARGDVQKLATLKATFLGNTKKYLLCVMTPGVPMTNNKAERSVRPLVIKRKLSFGSRMQKGADVMSILLSVCLTTWWSKPKNFYAAYGAIVRKWQAA